MIELLEAHPGRQRFSVGEIAAELGWDSDRVQAEAKRLGRAGIVEVGNGGIELTAAGMSEATFVVKSHRLWEHFLVYRDILGPDHVDRPADEVEHLLTPEIIARLEEILQREHGLDPARVINIHQTGSSYGGDDEERAAS